MPAGSDGGGVNVLLLSDSPMTYRAMNVVRCLRSAGVTVDVMSASGSRVFRVSRSCRHTYECGLSELQAAGEAVVSRVNAVCRRGSVDVVIPVDVESVLCVARIRTRIEAAAFPTPRPEVFATLHDKLTLAEFLADTDLPTPRTVSLDDPVGARALRYPVVVKPRRTEGGTGIRAFSSPEELGAYLHRPYARAPLLAQEAVDGKDVDLNILADGGRILVWTIQRVISPGVLEFVHDDRVLHVGRRLVQAADFDGPANIDMRLGTDGIPYIIDVNPFLWDTVTASRWAGVNFPVIGALHALGRPIPDASPPSNIGYLTPRRVVTTLLRGGRPGGISGASWRGLREVAAEPVTALVQLAESRFLARRQPM